MQIGLIQVLKALSNNLQNSSATKNNSVTLYGEIMTISAVNKYIMLQGI